jgi:hypothetical protein
MTAMRRLVLVFIALFAGLLSSGASMPAVEQPEVVIQSVRLVSDMRVLVTASLRCTPGTSYTVFAVVNHRGSEQPVFSAQGSTGGACDGGEASLSIPVILSDHPSNSIDVQVIVSASTCDARTCLTDEDLRDVRL